MTQPPQGGPYPPPSGPQGFPSPPNGPAGFPAPPGAPAGFPPGAGQVGQPAAVPPKRRRGPLIAVIVLVVALVLCGGGGTAAFFLLRNAETGAGAAEPTSAVQSFLTAVYQDRDVDRAAGLVCSSARDRKRIATKVAEVKKYAETHQGTRFRWSPPEVDDRTDERATVTTTVTATTADEKVTDQQLRFTVVRDNGWWVCEVG